MIRARTCSVLLNIGCSDLKTKDYDPGKHKCSNFYNYTRELYSVLEGSSVDEFIKSIDFHKGIFFLTQDRVNAMMACAEGIQGLYLQKPTWEQVGERPVARGELWRVVYELAVGFGQIRAVQGGEALFEASINWPAKHISEWERYCVRIL